MGRPRKSTVEELVSVTIKVTPSTREKWQSWCKRNETTVTAEIEKAMTEKTQGGRVGRVENLDLGMKQTAAVQLQQEKERLECLQAIADASLECWPSGELRIVQKQEHLSGKYHPKIRYEDEAGWCYDVEMRCWEPDGAYNPQKNPGAGMLRWMRTILPALQQGWTPREPVSDTTLTRVLYVIAQMRFGVQGVTCPESVRVLGEQLQAEQQRRKTERNNSNNTNSNNKPQH